MSARDSESGSSSYKGGSGSAGGIGNGGVGGGMGGGGGNNGGGWGGGAGRNGGYSNRTGLTTGTTWHGNTAWGRPGGSVQGYGTRDRNGHIGNRRNPDGSSVIKSAISQAAPEPVAAPPPVAPPPVGMPPPRLERSLGWLPGWPGTGQWWGDKPHFLNNSGLSRGQSGVAFGGAPLGDYNRPEMANGEPQNSPYSDYNGPGSTYNQNGNTVNQNNQGSVPSSRHGGGGR